MESLLYPAVRAESQAPLEPPLGHGHDGGRHAEGSSWVRHRADALCSCYLYAKQQQQKQKR